MRYSDPRVVAHAIRHTFLSSALRPRHCFYLAYYNDITAWADPNRFRVSQKSSTPGGGGAVPEASW